MIFMTIVYHDKYLEHIQGNHFHPESPRRLKAIRNSLEEHEQWKDIITPGLLPEEDLALVHSRSHIERLKNFGVGPLDPDTYMMEDSYEIARYAAGGTVAGLKYSMDHNRPSFVFPRPPGHHAGENYCGGFCYFNNVAIAAKKFITELEQIAIVDIDVHHGNGTNDIFYEDNQVLFVSTHQYGIFPGTGHYNEFGAGGAEGYTLNIPFVAQAGDASMKMSFDGIIMKVLEEFGPGAIVVSLGTDGHYNDPLSSNRMSSTVYVEMIKRLIGFAGEHCDGRIVVNLEGGYHVESLAEIMTHLVSYVATGEGTELEHTRVFDTDAVSQESVEQAREVAARFWKL